MKRFERTLGWRPTLSSLCRRLGLLWLASIGAVIGDETLSVGHPDLWQRRSVHDVVLADNSVPMQNQCRHGIHLVVVQQARIVKWHCPVDVVEKGGRIRPVTAYCL